MVATIKTWVTNPNDNLNSTTDQAIQYQTALLRIKQRLVDAGWSVTQSSDGASDGASDLWGTDRTKVVISTAVGTAHSWIILQAPAGWGNPTGANRYHLFLEAVANNTSVPQTFGLIFHSASITHSGLINRPTPAAGATSVTNGQIFNWTSAAPARASFWHTTGTYTGDMLVFTKRVADFAFTQSFGVLDPIFTTDANRGLLLVQTGAISNWYTSVSLRGTALDASAVTTPAITTVASQTGNWTSGMNANGQEGFFPIFVTANAGGQSARYYGYLPDVWSSSIASTLTFNYVDGGDTGAVKLRGFNNIGLPMASGDPVLE